MGYCIKSKETRHNGNSKASLACVHFKPHTQPYIVAMGQYAPLNSTVCSYDMLLLWTLVHNCTVPSIRLSYFSSLCCMTLSTSRLSIVSHLFYNHCVIMWRQYRVGCVVNEQVMPESYHYLHGHSNPCLVSLLFIPSL